MRSGRVGIYEEQPEHIAGSFGVQQFGLRADLWRVAEIVTEDGAYIARPESYSTRAAAVGAAMRMARSERAR